MGEQVHKGGEGSPFLHQHLAGLGLCKQLIHPSLLCVKVLPVEGLKRKGQAGGAAHPGGPHHLDEEHMELETAGLWRSRPAGEMVQATCGQKAVCPEQTGWLAGGHRTTEA